MDEDVSLPRTTIQKAVKGALPPGLRVSWDAIDVLTSCCNEFVHLISSQANVISERTKRSTITPDHVIQALEELGFETLVGPVQEVLVEFKGEQRQHQGRIGGRTAAGKEALSKEEMLLLQQQLFAQARERTLSEPSPMEAGPEGGGGEGPEGASL